MTDARRTTIVTTLFLSLCAASTVHADTLTLMWDANAEQVNGYVVYLGTAPGSYTAHQDVGNQLFYTMNNATAGQQYCFAVAAYVDPAAEGSKSAEVCGYSNQAPSLANPGNQTSTTGQQVSLQLNGSDPDGQPLSYSATGLPPGLTLMQSTGFISGAGTTAGTYSVRAFASDGVLSDTKTFTWTMEAAAAADTTPPVVTIAAPTSSSTFSTTTSTVSLAGTASDDGSISQVTWVSDRGASGLATGSTNWSVGSVGLQAGDNVITVSARDAAGNVGTDVLRVTYTPPDTSAPVVSITAPTSTDRYDTIFANVTLAGVASDNVGVTSVRWSNDRGGSGWASGTANWSIGSALQPGDNVITITARDAAGNQGTDVLTVVYTVPDLTAPAVSILDPTSADGYTTESQVVALSGVADDNVGVVEVTWSNNRGGSGKASGTSRWSVPSLTLQSGTNVITVTARDGAGNESIDMLTIEEAAPPPAPTPEPDIVLSVQVDSSRWWTRIQLNWTSTPGRYVDIYRDGRRVTSTRDDGSYRDDVRGSVPSTYQVCVSGTSTCSNIAQVGQ